MHTIGKFFWTRVDSQKTIKVDYTKMKMIIKTSLKFLVPFNGSTKFIIYQQQQTNKQ